MISKNNSVIKKSENAINILVIAKAGAKQNAIVGISEDGVEIQIKAPPVEGQANQELIKYVALVLGVRKNCIKMERGFKSRAKILTVLETNLTLDQVQNKLEKEINDTK